MDESNDVEIHDPCDGIVTDGQILNDLPLGREYVKKTLDDGALQWYLTKALNDQPIMRVTVHRQANAEAVIGSAAFDATTLY